MATNRKSSNGAGDDKDLEIKKLNRRVAALEKELAAVKSEKERYKARLDDWLRANCLSREEAERFERELDEKDFQPLENFIGELEAIVHKRKRGA